MIRRIRSVVYKLGFRPRPGSILHSPSLSLMMSIDTEKMHQQLTEAFERTRKTFAQMQHVDLPSTKVILDESSRKEASQELRTPSQRGVAFVESVFDEFKAPDSPDWEALKPRVERYMKHLYKEN